MSEQGPEIIKGDGAGEKDKFTPVSPDQREYLNIVEPLYAEQARLKGQLKDLPRTPENAGKAKEIKGGIRYAENQAAEARDSLLEGRISSFGQPGPRLTPAEIALNANRPKLEIPPAPAPVRKNETEQAEQTQPAGQAVEHAAEAPVTPEGVLVPPADAPAPLSGTEAQPPAVPVEVVEQATNKQEPTAEQKAIDEDRRKIEVRLEELARAQYQSADVKTEKEELETRLAELDSGKLIPERRDEIKRGEAERRDSRRREIESELEGISKSSYVTAELKLKKEKLQAELAVLDAAGAALAVEAEAVAEKEETKGGTYEELAEEARNKQAAAYSVYHAGKRAKKSGEELAGLLQTAEVTKNSHYELVARHVAYLIEEKSRELENNPDKQNELEAYRAELFNEYFIKEHERSQALNIETFPPKEKRAFQKAVNWWMHQPKWKRLAISTGVSLAVGVGTGAIATVPAVLVFGGAAVMRRWISGGASVGAGAATELGIKTWDKVFGGERKGVAYQERAMLEKFSGASFDEFMKMQQEYAEMRTLAEQREKRRRIGVLAAQVGVGVATSFVLGHHVDAVTKALHITQGEELLHKTVSEVGGAAHNTETGVGTHLPFVGHGASSGAAAEHVTGVAGAAAASETFTPDEYIQQMGGESVWSKVSDVLQSTKQFDALQSHLEASGLHGDALTQHLDAAKTYYIDAIKDRVVADPSKYIVGGKMNLSELFATPSGQAWLHETAAHAEGLSQADVQNIMHNNEALNQFTAKFPGQPTPSVAEAQQRLTEVTGGVSPSAASAVGHAAGAGATAPAEAFVMPAGDFTRATGEAFLSRLKDETLAPPQITAVLYDAGRIQQLAQATNSPFDQVFENLKTGLTYSQHTAEWLTNLNNETLRPADITTALGSKEWVDRLAQINGVSPDAMQKTLEDALAKSENIQSWMKSLDASQLQSAQIEAALSDSSWVSRMAVLDKVTPDKMHDILEQALNAANIKELFQGIAAGKVGSTAIKAAMENASWVNEAAKINNTTAANVQQILQAALTKATQAGK